MSKTTDVPQDSNPKTKTIVVRQRVSIPKHVIREQRRLSRMCGMPYDEYDVYEYEYKYEYE